MNKSPQYLCFLSLCYSMSLVLANWFDPRLIRIGPFNTDAGTLIFPFTFILADLITEVYGYRHARRAIWAGFLFNAIFIIYGQLIIHLPSPHYATHNHEFDQLLAMNGRIIIASFISYLIAEPLNSLLLSKLKIRLKGRFMALRFVVSTFFAAALDSSIFGSIAFSGLMASHDLMILIITMWLIKVAIECLGLPLSIYLAKKLKQIESLDIYDNTTRYNLFSLQADYHKEDNYYLLKQ